MEDLKDIRAEIDGIDDQLARLLVKRFEVVERVAKVKREKDLPVFDLKREHEIMVRVSELAGAEYEEDVCQLFVAIFALSRARQTAEA